MEIICRCFNVLIITAQEREGSFYFLNPSCDDATTLMRCCANGPELLSGLGSMKEEELYQSFQLQSLMSVAFHNYGLPIFCIAPFAGSSTYLAVSVKLVLFLDFVFESIHP